MAFKNYISASVAKSPSKAWRTHTSAPGAVFAGIAAAIEAKLAHSIDEEKCMVGKLDRMAI